jgi:dinuclear metal center YbgI/SA1388 family protein
MEGRGVPQPYNRRVVASRDEIIAFANDYLDLEAYPDYGPMGLQVVGAGEVTKIACGVSASLELFRRAAGADAQLLLVHHGLFWDRDPRIVDHALRQRLEALFAADLNLAAYHLALDAHPEVGNNALLCRTLGIEPERRFAGIGFGGPLREPCSIEELAHRVERELGRPPLVFPAGPEPVAFAAVCSGGAARHLAEAAAAGYDCYLTGEPAEPSMMLASEAGIHFVAAGHYATETLGVKALAARLAERFGLSFEFIDLPNPV